MTPTLPQPIAAYFAATNTHNIDAMLEPFADGAIVRDEGRERRGLDMLNAAYHYLDLVPKGRNESGLPSPQAWLRHHDDYGP